MLFAFGRTSGSFYVSHGSKNYWKGIPDTLVSTLKKEPWLHTISLGEGGAYFYKKMPTENSTGEYLVSAATAIKYPKVNSVFNSDETINWVAFGPGGAYVIDTPDSVIASDPSMTRNYTRDGKSTIVPLRCASFGPCGVWVVVEDDGEVRSKGLPQNVLDALSKKGVRKIELNPFSAEGFFLEYTDGTTTSRLPTSWHPHVEDIKKLNIQMDEPADSKKDLAKNILFTFSPQSDVYCISHQSHSVWTLGCPEALSSRLKKPGSPSVVSMGEGEAFFWKKGTKYFVSSETEMAYPEVWKIWKSGEGINWVTFGPEGYYIVDTPKRIYASRENGILRTYTKSGNQVPIRCAAFGWGGSWVIIEDDGVVRSHGLKPNVHGALLLGNVRHVALSWTNPNHFYIEYTDQVTNWHLPSTWHPKVCEVEAKLPTSPSILERLEKLPHGGGDFKKILAQFNTAWRDTWKNCPTIKHIYKIVLLDSIWDQYDQYLDKAGTEKLLFHGASRSCTIGDSDDDIELCNIRRCALCAIMRTSYSASNARSTGKLGIGIYTSSASSKAAHYAKNITESPCKAMLLNKVALGKPWFTDKAEGIRAPPKGYDSVCRKPGGPSGHQDDKMVVYNANAIRPEYLIIFVEF